MLNIEIVYLARLDKNWKSLKEHYLKMLKPYVSLKFNNLKAQSFDDKNKEKAIKIESDRIDKYLKKRNLSSIYLLSEQGKIFNSKQLSDFFYAFNSKNLVLVIGGPLGFSSDLKNKYSLLSLSALTFPHQMTQIILLEQIYRAIMIKKNKNYHY